MCLQYESGESHQHKLLFVISYVSLVESKSSMLIFQRQARDVGSQRNPHNNCKKNDETTWETHSCRMWKAWRCVTLEKQALFCCHGNGAYWVTVLPWHVSPQWCRPDHTYPHLTSCEEQGDFITGCVSVSVCEWERSCSFSFHIICAPRPFSEDF